MSTLVQEAEEIQEAVAIRQPEPLLRSKLGTALVPAILAVFSLAYFIDVLLRASVKYFWYDELFTVYMCQLPSFAVLWDALKHGADFNPPLFYLLTKASQALIGPGRIGTRVPEMIGFWLLCLSLFRFVHRRAGIPAGVIAMLLPVLSGAFYYAYEARPTGIVLGFCGLALVCWQMSIERRRSSWWVVAYSIALLAAFMTHCYAVTIAIPFGVAEIVRTVRSRRVDWPMWTALVAPAVVAGLSFVPLLMAYRSLSHGTNFQQMFPPSFQQIQNFYLFLLVPCTLLLAAGITLLALSKIIERSTPRPERSLLPWPEIALAVSFLALPVFGVVFGQVVHGPFFARYFVSAIVGACLLLALAAGAGSRHNWVAVSLALLMSGTAAWQVAILARHRAHHILDIIPEPSTGISKNSTLGGPLSLYSALTDVPSALPIVVLEPQDFIYLINYGPELRSRLYFLSPSKEDFFYRGFHIFKPWSPVNYNADMTFDEFLRSHSSFLVYGAAQLGQLGNFNTEGAAIKSFRMVEGRFLAELYKEPK